MINSINLVNEELIEYWTTKQSLSQLKEKFLSVGYKYM
jgi:hypothetical protein